MYIHTYRYTHTCARRIDIAGYPATDIDPAMCILRAHVCYHDIGWLRSVGSIKLQVSFAEYRLFDRALLQKRPREVSR